MLERLLGFTLPTTYGTHLHRLECEGLDVDIMLARTHSAKLIATEPIIHS